MALHRLTSITLGVPNVEETKAYYEEFGLRGAESGAFSTVDGGEQLHVVWAPIRRLLHLGIGADDQDDIERVAAALQREEFTYTAEGDRLRTSEPVAGISVAVEVAPRYQQAPPAEAPYNRPGDDRRLNSRAPGILRDGPVRPRRLGHVVVGSTDRDTTERFFLRGLGFKVSDSIRALGTFMRCSTDHHNVLVQSAPVNFLHHTAWQVDDVDEVGRGAMAMLEGHPERHGWGPGRHFLGSNFFWYLRDPAGNFAGYYSDLDTISDDQLWKPEVWEGAKGLFSWGPPPAPSFLAPDDLADMMIGSHNAK